MSTRPKFSLAASQMKTGYNFAILVTTSDTPSSFSRLSARPSTLMRTGIPNQSTELRSQMLELRILREALGVRRRDAALASVCEEIIWTAGSLGKYWIWRGSNAPNPMIN